MANAIYCVACWQFAREDLKTDKRLRQTAAFVRSTSKIVEWWKKKRAKRTKNVLQCPMC